MQEALYRKYRPDSLKKLVGQPDAVTLIEKQIKDNNLSHAYLFSDQGVLAKLHWQE